MGEVHRLPAPQVSFSLQTAGRLMTKIFPQWVQDLALLVEGIETVRPPGALPDWQPGAIVRLPYSRKTLQRRRGSLHAGAHGTGRHSDGAGLFGRVDRLPADEVDRPDDAFPAAGELRCHRRCARYGSAEMLASAVSCCLMQPTAGRSAWWQALTGCCEGANTQKRVANIASEAYHLLTVRYFASLLEALPWFKNWFENP